MFKQLKATNFFSWEELKFDFKDGLTLIQGFNQDDNTSEGSGKSSVINALSWCLYGQIPAKDITMDEVIREGSKTCSVEVQLISGHTIVRSRNMNDLYIIEPDGKKSKGKDIKETQKKITLLLGMSFETFAQSVFFAQNYNGKFITASQEDKAKVLSELQDLSWCDKSSKAAYDKYKESSLEINKLEYQLKQKEETKSLLKAQYSTIKEMNAKIENEKSINILTIKSKIGQNIDQILVYEKDMITLNEIGQYLKTNKDHIKDFEEQLMELNTLLSHIKGMEHQYLAAKSMKDCPTCGQAICREIVEPNYPEDPVKVMAIINDRKEELKERQRQQAEMLEQESRLKESQFKLNFLKKQNLDLELELKKAEQSDNGYIDKMADIQVKIDEFSNQINDLQIKSNLEHSKGESLKVLREGFKELKSHIFKSLLVQLNHKSNKYLQDFFDVSASISFTNVSEDEEISKIITSVIIDGNERSLGLLSGGQFRRVQIAVDFALSEIVSERRGNPMNIRILDEAFKDLSVNSMTKIIAILEKMPGSTVVIEHNELIKQVVHNTFNVKLVNGISYSY